MFESQITTLEVVEPTVSDVALQLMVATLKGGDYSDWDTVFRSAEKFVQERDNRRNKPDVATALCVCEEVEELLGMLEEGEYAEGWAKSALGKRLEDAVTKLHSDLNDAYDSANGWNVYPDVWPQSERPVLVKYDDWRYGVESAVFSSGVWLFKSLRPVVQWQEIKE